VEEHRRRLDRCDQRVCQERLVLRSDHVRTPVKWRLPRNRQRRGRRRLRYTELDRRRRNTDWAVRRKHPAVDRHIDATSVEARLPWPEPGRRQTRPRPSFRKREPKKVCAIEESSRAVNRSAADTVQAIIAKTVVVIAPEHGPKRRAHCFTTRSTPSSEDARWRAAPRLRHRQIHRGRLWRYRDR